MGKFKTVNFLRINFVRIIIKQNYAVGNYK
jgi:hypothetical protein